MTVANIFTDNLYTSCTIANFLLEKGTFSTGTMGRNQLKNITAEIAYAKPGVGEKVYYRKNNFPAELKVSDKTCDIVVDISRRI